MNDDHLEKLIRSLKPAPLPSDLKERMSVEPIRDTVAKPVVRVRRHLAIVAVAAVLIAAVIATALFQSDQNREVAASDPKSPVSVVQKESTLLKSRTLSIKEIDGQLWEVAEEEWRDDILALCSTSPIKLASTVIRHEVVCHPVEFH